MSGSPAAVITGVRVVGGEGALRFLGAMVADPNRNVAVTEDFHSYPPRGPADVGALHPAVGTRLLPKDDTRGDGV
jgi:hypothetical protein